jgi:RHS repeat-associated protein
MSGGLVYAQSCPHTPNGGGESINAWITVKNTGAPVTNGMVVPAGTQLRLDAVAESQGSCIGRAPCGNEPCDCKDSGFIYERTINHTDIWADISTATSLNGSYMIGYVVGKHPNGTTADWHVLDTTASNSSGPAYETLFYPGTYHFHFRAVINTTPCEIMPDRTEMITITVHVRDKGDDWNGGPTDCNSNVGEPINVTNGNMYIQQTDYSLPGVGEENGLRVTRTYNSYGQEKRTGLFGYGWSTEFDESINAYGTSALRLNLPTGRAVFFTRGTTSVPFTPYQAPDFDAQLVKNADGTYTLTYKDGRVHQFNANGKLTSFTDRNNNQIVLTYNAAGRLTTVTDAFGRVLNLTPNDNGQITSISDQLGTIATYTYGFWGRLETVTYPDGSKYRFTDTVVGNAFYITTVWDAYDQVLEYHEYDSQGRATLSRRQAQVERYTLNYVSPTETHVTDALGNVSKYFFDKSKGRNLITRVEGDCGCAGSTQSESWTYDAQSNISTRTNALGRVTTYTYDPDGNPLTVADASGTTTYTYNQLGQPLTITDPLNGVTTNVYDARGNLLSSTDMTGGVTTYVYDARGLLQSVTDPRNKTTQFEYDAQGNLSRRKDALNNSTTYTYDARGRVTATTDAANNTHSFTYDAVGRIKTITQPDTTTVTFTYDLAGRRTKVTDARGNNTTFAYDTGYRMTSQTDAANKTTTYAYDLMSNLTGMTDALGRTTNYTYDSLGRLTKIIYPEATAGAGRLEEQFGYDAQGNLTQKTDQAGRTTTYTYDTAGRLVEMTDPALKTTRYEYNARSQRTAVVDATNQRYEFAYDAQGRMTQTTRGGANMAFVYDAAGNRTRRTDYNGAITDYTYDALNRLTRIDYPGGAAATYAYDPMSRITSATNAHGTVSVTYNSLGRVSSATDVWGQSFAYTYDGNGNRTQMSMGVGNTTGYQYDALNRLTQLTDRTGAAFVYTHDANSNLTSRTAPNGVTSTYSYDGIDRLTRLRHVKGLTTVDDYQYQLNPVGNVTQITEPAGTHAFVYDAVDRLTAATHPSLPSESYEYSAVGNRTSSHRTTTYSYQTTNKLLTAGQTSYTYDANGNLTSKTDGVGTWLYGWDYENRLTQVTRPDGQVITYKYDALGRRIERGKGSAWTRFSYDGEDVALDTASDGTTVEYVNGLALDEKLLRRAGGATQYFAIDHLGSTRALTDASGAVVERQSYDSFGDGAGSAITRYGYTGREADTDTGLLYYRARWYDPQTGRFISEDPIGFDGGINWYAYVENNPANLVDPSGLKPSLGRCLIKCSSDQLGLTTLFGAAGAAAGAPTVKKPFVTPGSSPRTSVASKWLSDLLPQKMGRRLWAPTVVRPFAKTAVLGRFVGRWIPIVGWGLLAYDAVSIGFCANDCMKGDCP